MKTRLFLVASFLLCFIACKSDKKTDEAPAEKTETDQNAAAGENPPPDPPLNYCQQNVFKFNVENDGYDTDGSFIGYINIPTGEATDLTTGNRYVIDTQIEGHYDISTATRPIILQTRYHGKPYFARLCNLPTRREVVSANIQNFIPGFDPSNKEKVYFFVLHDESFAQRSRQERDDIIARIRAELDRLQPLDDNPEANFIKVLDSIKDYDMLRPNTIGQGVVPPKR